MVLHHYGNDVISGMPQGSVLGPILFIVYMNTLTEVVKYSDSFLFADDNKLCKTIHIKQDSSLLQYDIDSMYNWTLNPLLLFHPRKCFTIMLIASLLVLLIKLHIK